MIESLSDLQILALTIYGEARGEPIEGQIAVGCVIRNRTNGKGFSQICLAPKQFSCWNKSDPNRIILEEIAQKLITKKIIQDTMFDQINWIAKGIINDLIIDNTHGAKNYLTRKLFINNPPSWAQNVKDEPLTIGKQVFFNA